MLERRSNALVGDEAGKYGATSCSNQSARRSLDAGELHQSVNNSYKNGKPTESSEQRRVDAVTVVKDLDPGRMLGKAAPEQPT